eukprot:SAG22_NODE_2075_length_3046_cov_2.125212_2_plen_446_part_00
MWTSSDVWVLIVCGQVGEGECLFCGGTGEPLAGAALTGAALTATGGGERDGQPERQQGGGGGGGGANRRQQQRQRGGGGGRQGQQQSKSTSSKVKIVVPKKPAAGCTGAADAATAAAALQERARVAKDKLLEFDRTAAARTQVIDDQSDWYDASATSLMWLSETERKEKEAAAAAKEAAEKEADEQARRVTISFDFAGRRVVAGRDSTGGGGGGPEEHAEEAEDGGGGAAEDDEGVGHSAYGGQANNVLGGGGAFSNPFLAGPRPNYQPTAAGGGVAPAGPAAASAAAPAAAGGGSGRSRVQAAADELDFWGQPFEPVAAAPSSSLATGSGSVSGGSQVPAAASNIAVTAGAKGGPAAAAVRDDGQCLSMHQPWASLLVAGIKQVGAKQLQATLNGTEIAGDYLLTAATTTHSQVEGRSWPTAHRGRLWIAATARPAEPVRQRLS